MHRPLSAIVLSFGQWHSFGNIQASSFWLGQSWYGIHWLQSSPFQPLSQMHVCPNPSMLVQVPWMHGLLKFLKIQNPTLVFPVLHPKILMLKIRVGYHLKILIKTLPLNFFYEIFLLIITCKLARRTKFLPMYLHIDKYGVCLHRSRADILVEPRTDRNWSHPNHENNCVKK